MREGLISEGAIDVLVEKITTMQDAALTAEMLAYKNEHFKSGFEADIARADKKIDQMEKVANAEQAKADYAALPLSIRANMNHKLNPRGAVLLLEEVVLYGTLEDLKHLFAQKYSFEFTARALGYALRYRTADFVEMLSKHGATFSYVATASMVKKYSSNTQYALCILKGANLCNIKGLSLASTEEICRGLTKLNVKKNKHCLQHLLFEAILSGEREIVETLKGMKICSICAEDERIASRNYLICKDTRTNNSFKCQMLNQTELVYWKLDQMLAAMKYGKILLDKWTIYTSGVLNPVLCQEDVFDLVIAGNLYLYDAKRGDLLDSLMQHENVKGLQYARDQGWGNTGKKALLKRANKLELKDGMVRDWIEQLAD